MPKLRKTPREIGNIAFRAALARTMEEQEVTKSNLADDMGVSCTTFYKRWDKPENLTVRELFGLYKSKRLTDADILKIITGKESEQP